MDEYIEKEAMRTIIREQESKHGLRGMAWVEMDMDRHPAADVVPVQHGRWECQKPCPVCWKDRFEGLDADIWADWEPLYCPNCGAKMDLEDEDHG